MERSFQSKPRDKCCCSEHPLAFWSNPSLISKVVCSKSTCYWLQYYENWLAHMQDCNLGKSVFFNVFFAVTRKRGCGEEKRMQGSKTRQNVSICFQSVFIPIKTFCQIKEINYCTVFGGWCNSFCSLWACSQMVSFCRLEELWFTVWGILTVGSQVLKLSKHSIGCLFFQGVFWQMVVAKKIHSAFHLC